MARLSELTAIGATAASVSRLEREGSIIRLARGMYQLPDAPIDTHHSLAELAKLVPKGVVCPPMPDAKQPRDRGTSVRASLLALARQRRQAFDLLLTRYVMERLLHRLSLSGHAAPTALTPAFSADAAKRMQWAAFARDLAIPVPDFSVVVEDLAALLMPHSRRAALRSSATGNDT